MHVGGVVWVGGYLWEDGMLNCAFTIISGIPSNRIEDDGNKSGVHSL